MNWPSFTAGMTLTAAMLVALYATAPQVPPVWRQCAPAQADERLVSATQYTDRTDCFYVRNVAKGAVVKKKVSG